MYMNPIGLLETRKAYLTRIRHGTNRDIYYYDTELFGGQWVVDTIVRDIAHTFGIDRRALNVVYSSPLFSCRLATLST